MLGPVLFIISISDKDSGITSDMVEFVNDFKIGCTISTGEDARALQDRDEVFIFGICIQIHSDTLFGCICIRILVM